MRQKNTKIEKLRGVLRLPTETEKIFAPDLPFDHLFRVYRKFDGRCLQIQGRYVIMTLKNVMSNGQIGMMKFRIGN